MEGSTYSLPDGLCLNWTAEYSKLITQNVSKTSVEFSLYTTKLQKQPVVNNNNDNST